MEKSVQRPYWHVDAKWICSSIFMFIFGFMMLFYGLADISNEKNGINLLTKIVALQFSRNGLDDASEISTLKDRINASPSKSIKPIPTLNIEISQQDILDKTPREIRLGIFRGVAQPIYFGGKGVESLLDTPEKVNKFNNDTVLLRSILSDKSHALFSLIFKILAFVSVVLAIFIAFFSYRFGRIANIGLAILLSALPYTVIFTILSLVSSNIKTISVAGGEEAAYSAMVLPYIKEIAPTVTFNFMKLYIIALCCGIFLLVVAGILRLVNKMIKKV